MAAFPTMQDEAAIRQLVKDCVRAWNRRDRIAWGQPFAENADYCTVYGSKLTGRTAIIQQALDARCRGMQLETHIDSVRFVRPDVACIEAVSNVDQADIAFGRVVSTIVVVKDDDMWRIVVFSNAGILRTEADADGDSSTRR